MARQVLPHRRPSPLFAALAQPLCDISAAERRWTLALAVLLAGLYALLYAAQMGGFFFQSDIVWYAAIAEGHTREVMQPFASRQLGPLVVRALEALFHLSLQQAFSLEGAISLLATLAAVVWLVLRSQAPRWLLAALLAVPFWPQLLFGLALPDLWYAALLSLFLLLLYRGRLLLAAAMMLPLMVSRESTSLTLVCFAAAVWTQTARRRWSAIALAAVAAGTGSQVVAHLTAGGIANLERLPQFVYLASKVPWNLLQNLFGMQTWTNINSTCGVPVWQHPLHLGAVRAVGFCGFAPLMPLIVLQALLTTFGLLPPLVLLLWIRARRPFATASPLLRFCLVYGTISFVLAPVIGVWIYRLFGYAWPLFLVAIPLLFDRVPRPAGHPGFGVLFCALHLLCCGLGFLNQLPAVMMLEVLVWGAGILALQAWFGVPFSRAGSPRPGTLPNPA